MQIWKKNFLSIYALFLVVIYGGFLFLESYISQNEMQQWIRHARNNEESIFYLAAGLKDEELSRMSMNLQSAAEKYLDMDIQIRVRVDTYIAADYLQAESVEGKAVEIRTWKGERYLIIQEEQDVGGDIVEVVYAENLKELSQARQKRMLLFCIAGLIFSGIIGIFLYYTMRRINRPVNQIAHELRTPLTGIRGYAEYIMMGKLDGEDLFFAAKQIVDSAKSLEDVTEKLLIMGNVKEGAIKIRRINLKRLFQELGEKYPDARIECCIEFLNGDEALVSSLLENLTANAFRAGDRVKVTADETGICVWNNGEALDKRILKAVNRGQDTLDIRGGGHGYGIQICREIAMVHGWKLFYQSSEEEGTTAVCRFRS